MQQILFKFWILAHLHVYFVLHSIKEKKILTNYVLTNYILTLIWSSHFSGTLEYVVIKIVDGKNGILLPKLF